MHETIIVNVAGEVPFFSHFLLIGPKTYDILKKIFNVELKPGEYKEATLKDPRTKRKVDRVKIVYLDKNQSDINVPMAMIAGTGGYVIPTLVEMAIAKGGARMAAPYEIVKYRYLLGSIDLLMAHGYMDMLNARTEKGVQIAQRRYEGALSERFRDIIDSIRDIASSINGMDEDKRKSIIKRLSALIGKIRFLYAQGIKGMVYVKGLEVAIVGRPNVGKSTLFNRLVGKERSIVTHIPGTTRDIIKEAVEIEGVALTFYDTAGYRETEEYVEKIGVERSKKMLDLSHFVLFVLDASTGLLEGDKKLWKMLKGERIVVFNKIDQAKDLESFEVLADLHRYENVFVSGKTGEGFGDLIRAVKNEINKYFHISEDLALTKREGESLRYVLDTIEDVKEKLKVEGNEISAKAKLENAANLIEDVMGISWRTETKFKNALSDILEA